MTGVQTCALPILSYNFDKQRDYSVLRVWLTPADVQFTLPITCSRKLQDFSSPTDNPDFPQEWQECLICNLAIRIAPHYGKNKGDKYMDLVQKASTYLADMKEFDNEAGSVFITPGDYEEDFYE